MDVHTENIIYLKASKCLDSVNRSIQLLNDLLQKNDPSRASDYYLARNYMRKGAALYEEALEKAKKLLGPTPEYVPEKLEKWRSDMLERNQVLAKSEKKKDLRTELKNDEVLKRWVSPKEIDAFLRKHFKAQKSGVRKLSNIKVRIILDKLKELLIQAQELQKKTMEQLKI